MLIERCVIDTYSLYVCVFFGYDDWIGYPTEVFISLINLAFSSLCNSDAIAFLLGSSNHRNGCLTGFALGSTFNACSTSSLGTPGMSEGYQANISQRSWRNSMSALSYVGSRFTAIDVVLFGSVGWTWIFFES
jgi:hypothetical protein